MTFEIRKLFLRVCREAAQAKGLQHKIHLDDVKKLRSIYKEKVEAKGKNGNPSKDEILRSMFRERLGMWDNDMTLLQLFQAGQELVESADSDWFYFRDFNYYYTVVVPKRSFFQNATAGALLWLLGYYFASAVFFCAIVGDKDVCPDSPEGRSYDGWLTTIYFSSVTLSTVGYGDVSVSKDQTWRVFIGIAFMLVSLGVGLTVFSTAASTVDVISTARPFSDRLVSLLEQTDGGKAVPLYKRARRMYWSRAVELICYFFLLNLVGMFAARLFIRSVDIDEQQWTWMETFYWAVQTTTTIGEQLLLYIKYILPFYQSLAHLFLLIFCRIWGFEHALSTSLVPNLLHGLGHLYDRVNFWIHV